MPSAGWVIPVLAYLGNWDKSKKLGPNNQHHWNWYTEGVLSDTCPTVKLHISHRMKPYSDVKNIWGLIYISFSIFWAQEQVPVIGPKYPISWAWIYRNSSKVLNSTFHNNWSLTWVENSFEGRVSPVLGYLGHQGTLGKLGPNKTLIPKIINRKIRKVIPSLQLIILHKVRLTQV